MQKLIILPTRPDITPCTQEFRGGRIDCSTVEESETARTATNIERCTDSELPRKPAVLVQTLAIESPCC
jgi:hypothetical protein